MATYNFTQTGAEIQAILDRVEANTGATYMGVATPSTDTSGITTQKVFYIAGQAGTYTNMGGSTHSSGIGIFVYNGSAWSYQNVPSAAVVATDATPTANSTNPVQSGGLYNLFEGNLTTIDVTSEMTENSGKSINKTTGAFSQNSGYTTYSFILPTDAERVTGSSACYKDSVLVSFYNGTQISSDTWMSQYVVLQSVASGQAENFNLPIPTGAKLVAVVKRNSYGISTTLNYQRRENGIIKRLDNVENITEFDNAAIQDYINPRMSIYGAKDVGYILQRDGTLKSSTGVFGASDYIPLTAYTKIKVISGVYTPNNYNYVAVCYYDKNKNFLYFYRTTSGTTIDGYETIIPYGVAYMRVMLQDSAVPANIKIEADIAASDRVNYIYNLAKQISNYPLPTKGSGETLKILFLGSSWGVDQCAPLSALANNVGLNLKTGDLYKSGGSISEYLADIDNDGKNTFYVNENGTNTSSSAKTVLEAIQYDNWDVCLLMLGADTRTAMQEGRDEDFAKWLSYIKKNLTNPRAAIGLCVNWTGKDEQYLQETTYIIGSMLSSQTGIDIIVPTGSAFNYLKESSLNDGNDLYRDDSHLNLGVGRFTAACTVFMSICEYIYGYKLTTCTLSGNWTQGAGEPTYATIDVGDSNRQICIDCARAAVADIYGVVTTLNE